MGLLKVIDVWIFIRNNMNKTRVYALERCIRAQSKEKMSVPTFFFKFLVWVLKLK